MSLSKLFGKLPVARMVFEENSGCRSPIEGLWKFLCSTGMVPVEAGKP